MKHNTNISQYLNNFGIQILMYICYIKKLQPKETHIFQLLKD